MSYFTLTAHLSWDQPRVQGSVTTCGRRPLCGTGQRQVISTTKGGPVLPGPGCPAWGARLTRVLRLLLVSPLCVLTATYPMDGGPESQARCSGPVVHSLLPGTHLPRPGRQAAASMLALPPHEGCSWASLPPRKPQSPHPESGLTVGPARRACVSQPQALPAAQVPTPPPGPASLCGLLSITL